MMRKINYFGLLTLIFLCNMCTSCQSKDEKDYKISFDHLPDSQIGSVDTATFAAGCFWCVEAQFKTLDSVQHVISGYTGGKTKNPTYVQVITGATGHAEAIQVIYDPNKITYDRLLEAFFIAHDPTQFSKQGNDVGTQYRAAIFVHDKQQLAKVDYYLKKVSSCMINILLPGIHHLQCFTRLKIITKITMLITNKTAIVNS